MHRARWRGRRRRGVGGAIMVAALVTLPVVAVVATPAFADSPTPTATTTVAVSAGSTSTLAGLSLSGSGTVAAILTTTNGALAVPSTAQTGLTLGPGSAWSGASSLAFSGPVATVNQALAAVQLTTTWSLTSSAATVTLQGDSSPSVAYDATGGHYYEYVAAAGITWSAALAAAQARTFQGLHGYLATVTSAHENAFVAGVAGTTFWLGGTGTTTAPRLWTWADGPEAGRSFTRCTTATGACDFLTPVDVGFTAWNAGEPNNSPIEDSLSSSAAGGWNDLPGTNSSRVSGYVVEYGGLPSDASTVSTASATVQVTGAPMPVPTATETSATAGATSTLGGLSVSGLTGSVTVSVIVGVGTVAVPSAQQSGLTLATASAWSGASATSFSGPVASVNAALAAATVTLPSTAAQDSTFTVTLKAWPTLTGLAANVDTGHFYERVVAAGITWTAARTAARALSGGTGYLATVTSASEQATVAGLAAGFGAVWLGGTGTTTAPRVWTWADGPEAGTTFTRCTSASGTCDFLTPVDHPYWSWAGGEPNNSSSEDSLSMYAVGTWNDLLSTNTGDIAGYVAELDSTALPSASATVHVRDVPGTPVPSAVAAAPVGGGSTALTVSWPVPSSGWSPITGYQWSLDSSTWTPVTPTVVAGVASFPMTGLTPGASYTVRIRAVNGIGTSAVGTAAAVRLPVAPSAVSGWSTQTFVAGSAMSARTLAADGFPAPTFMLTAGALPAGVTLDPATGVVSGTPTAGGDFTATLSAGNVAGTASTTVSGHVWTAPGAPALTVPRLVVGSAVSVPVTAAGDPAPTFAVTAGALPTGLALTGSGPAGSSLTGTPTVPGQPYSFTVTATGAVAGTSIGTSSTTVTGHVDALTTTLTGALPSLLVGVALTPVTLAADGYPAATVAVTAGALPAGLTLSTAGVVSGTPTAAGPWSATVTAAGSHGSSATLTLTGTVRAVPTTLSGALPAVLVVGTAITPVAVVGDGYPAPTYAVTAGALPTGLGLDPTTGAVTGTPTTGGGWAAVITATNAVGSVSTTLTGHVWTPPGAVRVDLPALVAGDPVSTSVTATGDPAPVLTVTAGALPAGLTFTGSTISGTPTVPGQSWTVTLTATGTVASSAIGTSSTTLSGHVDARTSTLTGALPALLVGDPIAPVTLVADGYPAPTFSVSAGALPAGLTLSAGGTITGIPTLIGAWSATVTATGSHASAATLTLSGTVRARPAGLLGLPAELVADTPVTATLTTAAGDPAPTWEVTAGSLPAGLTLTPAGVLSGTPSTAGPYTATLTATNDYGTTTAPFAGTVLIGVPGAPTGLVAAATDRSAVLTFTPPAAHGGVTPDYQATADGTTWTTLAATPRGGALTATLGGLATGVPVAVRVRAVTAAGAGPASDPATVTPLGPPTALTGALPTTLVVGRPVTPVTFAADGYPAPTWAVTAGALPAGLHLDPATGTLDGTPTVAGGVTVTITATTSTGAASTTLTGRVDALTTTLTGTLPTLLVGDPMTPVTLTADGYPTPTLALTAGALPAGLSLAADGTITGTATTVGPWSATVTATGSHDSAAPLTLSGTVHARPTGISGWPTTLSADTPVTGTLSTAGGDPAPTFAVTAGAVPAGLTLTSAGVIAGTPATAGPYDVTLTATNVYGATSTEVTGTVLVAVPGAPTGLAAAQADRALRLTFTPPATRGGVTPGYQASTDGTTWTTLTVVPSGAALTATLPGLTPGVTVAVAVRATTPAGAGPASSPATATPGAVPGTLTGAPATLTAQTPVDLRLGVTAGYPTVRWAVTAGALPVGTALDAEGRLTGTPTLAGTSRYQVTATNALGSTTTAVTTTVVAVLADAPTDLTATAGDHAATLTLTAPARTGGLPLTGYQVTIDGGLTWFDTSATLAAGQVTIGLTGLTAGSTYPVAVRAATAAGPSAATPVVSVRPYAPAARTLPAPQVTTHTLTLPVVLPVAARAGLPTGNGLAATGAQVGPVLSAAVVLLVCGALLLAIARRRRPRHRG